MIEIHNSSPTNGRRVNLRVSYRNRFQSVDVGMRRMTMSGGTQGKKKKEKRRRHQGETIKIFHPFIRMRMRVEREVIYWEFVINREEQVLLVEMYVIQS